MIQNSDKKLIMVVDDETDIRTFLDILLTIEGYHVTTHANIASAVRTLDEITPHVVLLDYMLPGETVDPLVKKLRGSPNSTMILMTAARDASAYARQLELEHYLSKPFDIDHLLEMVRRYAYKPGAVLKGSGRSTPTSVLKSTHSSAAKAG